MCSLDKKIWMNIDPGRENLAWAAPDMETLMVSWIGKIDHKWWVGVGDNLG